MKTLIALIALTVCVLLPSGDASAHVLVTDETKTNGAVLHIIPDDDPIAGENATLYFDMQEKPVGDDSTVALTITGAAGDAQSVPVKINGTLVTAEFVFPVQGVYDITFTVRENGMVSTFSQAQRITRGVSDSPLDRPSYAWAEVLLIASAIGFALLIIIAINHRKDIAKHSAF